MRIATWNIDDLKTRRDELLRWLRENQPDIMALQETKTDDDAFRERYEPVFEAGDTARRSMDRGANAASRSFADNPWR